jgi:hypothetical protein
MGEPDEPATEPAEEPAHEPPLTVALLAELQAGLLDDDVAARVRGRVRDDPEAAELLRSLNQVRSDLATAGAAPAPDPPPGVAARISAALRSASGAPPGGAAHSARPQIRPARVIAGAVGLCAVVAAIGFGTAALLRAPAPVPSAPVTAEHITVSMPPMTIPLSQAQILGLLDHAPDYGAPGGPLGGALNDPSHRASCLTGLGYPASTRVLGARPIDINVRPAILLVLPGETPAELAVFAVAPNCSAADTGLLASTGIPRS